MATCGYLCPLCEGKGILDDGSDCTWCTVKSEQQKTHTKEELDEWIEKVHQGPCCSDRETTEDCN